MARRNTADEAYRKYFEPLERALGCIASERFSFVERGRFDVGPVYTLVLNRNNPVKLMGRIFITLAAGQRFRMVKDDNLAVGPYFVQLVSYWYEVSTTEDREILAFHWTPEADPSLMRTTPHLHVGSVNIAKDAPLAPKAFNKLHIPTGDVSLQAVVRFLIEEAGVEPRRADWSEILDRGQAQFELRSR